jgi:hypothetical protein
MSAISSSSDTPASSTAFLISFQVIISSSLDSRRRTLGLLLIVRF